MARHEAPVRAHVPKQSAAARAARGPQRPVQAGPCSGPAAQLAAVHRTLRRGPVLQLQPEGAAADARPAAAPKAAGSNRTGLPDRLKAGVEALSGVSLDEVKVHYNSSRPAQLNALAYAQGRDIHLAPGQERHLPHEAWHVVQQKQGRVRPTQQMKNGTLVNDNAGLEREADLWGARALGHHGRVTPATPPRTEVAAIVRPGAVAQRIVHADMPTMLAAVWPGPGAAPGVANFSRPLRDLFADAAAQLAVTDFRPMPALDRIAAADVNPVPPPQFILSYRPAGVAPDILIASILHELLHVSTEVNYRKAGANYRWLNMNLPPGVILPDDVGAEVQAQMQVLEQNLNDAVAVVGGDALLPPAIKERVEERLNDYALIQPDVHYDTVLADILAHLELNGINSGPTFNFIARLVKESTNRRLVNPWWGTKTARRVDRNAKFWQFWKW